MVGTGPGFSLTLYHPVQSSMARDKPLGGTYCGHVAMKLQCLIAGHNYDDLLDYIGILCYNCLYMGL